VDHTFLPYLITIGRGLTELPCKSRMGNKAMPPRMIGL